MQMRRASLAATLKKRGHNTHFNDNCRRSSGDEPPSKCDTPVPSDGEVDDKSRNNEKSNSNYHVNSIPKKRKVVEKDGVGHKSLTPKKSKSEKENKRTPEKIRISNSDGDLNLFDTDDVTSDDAFGFDN
jgi:hypothetical protein